MHQIRKSMHKDDLWRFNLGFCLLLLAYIVLGIILLEKYRYQINGDGVAQINIARRYMAGEFAKAVSGYRPPLISWILIPFLHLGFEPVYAFKLLQLLLGLITLLGVKLLSYKFKMQEYIRNTILFLFIPHILYFALSMITPDLLTVCLLVYYLNIIFDPGYPEKKINGVFCGLLGAFAFLAKTYNFYFFALHFFVFNLLHYLRSDAARRIKVIQVFLLGIVFFIACSLPWIAVLSYKFHKITVSPAGGVTYAVFGPTYKSGWPPITPSGIAEPWVWEDYANYKVEPWSPFESPENFKYQLSLIANTLQALTKILIKFSPLYTVILLGYILLMVPFKGLRDNSELLFPVLTPVIYTSGYLLINLEERYIWITYILFGLMGGYIINLVFQNGFFSPARKRIALVFLALTFLGTPKKFIKPLFSNTYINKEYYDLSKLILEKYQLRDKRIVSDNTRQTYFVSCYLNSDFYGSPRPDITRQELEEALVKYNIDYYFVWDDKKADIGFLSRYRLLTGIPDLKIYSLKEKIQ